MLKDTEILTAAEVIERNTKHNAKLGAEILEILYAPFINKMNDILQNLPDKE